jgi:hypothetical protein
MYKTLAKPGKEQAKLQQEILEIIYAGGKSWGKGVCCGRASHLALEEPPLGIPHPVSREFITLNGQGQSRLFALIWL